MNSLKEHITIITLLVVGNDGMLPVMKLTIETLFYCKFSHVFIGYFSIFNILSIRGHMN